MRDGQIYGMQAANARRDALILDQWMFIETRQRAFEQVFMSLTILARLALLFRPRNFKVLVDKAHLELLNEEKAKRDAAVKKVKEEMAKPKLTIVGANGLTNGR